MYSVLKGAAYFLAHTPEMVVHNGTTQTTQRKIDPNAEYLAAIRGALRSYDEVLAYLPNQVYIGNLTPDDLEGFEMPWQDKKSPVAARVGKYGEIMPEDEFIGMMKICDVFDLVQLEANFSRSVKEKLAAHPLIDPSYMSAFDKSGSLGEVEAIVQKEHADPIFFENKLVGCVRSAHAIDENLFAHVIFENLVSKASCVLSILHLTDKSGIARADVDYVIECSEEACGDMNQRGGGNFAKAVAEAAGLVNATGCDTRGFCAGPAHAIVQAASLVRAGTFKNVVVAAGGSTAKLGMNGKDHVKKGLPILEDVVGGFAVLISANDGVNPELNVDIVGRHTVGTGSSPQKVIEALCAAPLAKHGLKLTDVDKYSVEMQNPDITKPAGAGNVPEANYKMIGALAAMRGDIQKADLGKFVAKHGMAGWAPTQGHIPSGVPYLGFMREDMLAGKISRAMIVGKGSLFLGRMTNQFDGISIVVQKNSGKGVSESGAAQVVTVALTATGSEHGPDVPARAALEAARQGLRVKLIGGSDCNHPNVDVIPASDDETAHKILEELLDSGEAEAGVTMHYSFPIGVSTVGRIVTPAEGRPMYIACTTGTSSTDRVEAMVRNAVYGIAAAKSCGVDRPTVGILNLDGARAAETALKKLASNGYGIEFAESGRADGGSVMRGNDLLTGACDVMVADALTGNILMKTFSSYTTGGNYEALGWGYGPGLGEGFNRLVMIVSRASGVPVIANAVSFAAELVRGHWRTVLDRELSSARAAGLDGLVRGGGRAVEEPREIAPPPKEVVTEEILGIEIMDLDEAARVLWANGIYAESGMGCTGPVILVSEAKAEEAVVLLRRKGFILDA
jgi:betaine reductase